MAENSGTSLVNRDGPRRSGAGPANSRRRLGQLVVERGWISGEQLMRALDHQQWVGGRLGTCLLEMGALDERQLIETLADQLGAPPAPLEALDRVPPEVAATLTAELARRSLAMPFAASAKTLSVATLEPHDLNLLDELAFASNRQVLPHVVTEVRLAGALERYYGLPSEPRLRYLLERLEHGRYQWVDGSADLLTGDPAVPIWQPPPSQPESGTAPAPLTAQLLSQSDSVSGGDSLLDDASALDLIGAQLEQVTSPEQLVDLLVDFLERHFERRAVLRVSGETLRGWRASGSDLDPTAFQELSIDLSRPSVFSGLRREFQLYRGALPPVAAHLEFAKCWGGELTETCMMWPVRIQDHLACILYGDRFTGDLDALDPALYPTLAHQAALAMQRFILNRKRQSPT